MGQVLKGEADRVLLICAVRIEGSEDASIPVLLMPPSFYAQTQWNGLC